MDKNLVSVNIITRNNGLFLRQAIQSILNQTYQNLEIIIIDDCSDDETSEIVMNIKTKIPIKYFRNNERFGISRSRNLGIEKSQGEYIAVLDGDDFWNDNYKIEKQVEFLDKNTEYALVGTNVIKINTINEKTGNIIYKNTDSGIRTKMLFRNQFTQSSILIRKNIIKNFQYDNALEVWEDYDLWLRIGRKYKFANLSDFSTSYRIHKNNISKEYKIKGNRILSKILSKNKDNYPNYFLAKIKMFLRTLKNNLHL